jgi:hypothetical protein
VLERRDELVAIAVSERRGLMAEEGYCLSKLILLAVLF